MDSTQPSPDPKPKSQKVLLLRIALAVLLIGGGIWAGIKIHARQEALRELHQEMDSEAFAHEATVQITAKGFVPSKITVAKSTRIYFENKDTVVHSLVTDDATAKLVPNLGRDEDTKKVQEIAPSGGHAFSFHDAGTFRAHDGHNPTANVEIEVR